MLACDAVVYIGQCWQPISGFGSRIQQPCTYLTVAAGQWLGNFVGQCVCVAYKTASISGCMKLAVVGKGMACADATHMVVVSPRRFCSNS